MLERYSTERIPPLQRIRRWCEFGSSTLSRLSVQPYVPGDFNARMLRVRLGDLGITQMHTTPAFAAGRGGECGGWGAARSGSVLITLQKAGKSRFRQFGREAVLAPGDIVIRDLRRSWELDACQDTTLVSVKVSAASLVECLGDLDAFVAVPLRAGDRCTDLLASVMENLARVAFGGPAYPDPKALQDLIFASAKVAYSDGRSDLAALSGHEAEQQRILHYVDAQLHDSSVSVAGLSEALQMSVRSFQRVFQERGTSPRAYILSRRLEHAAERLRGLPRGAGAKVTGVALACGFNDPSYFGRAFQQHFGMTPSEFLRRNREED